MIITLLNWLVIVGCCIVIGRATLNIWSANQCVDYLSIDLSFFAGIVVLTLYAQTISLFRGVGKERLANVELW